MKSAQLIEYNMKNIFLKNYGENNPGRLAPASFFFFFF